MDAEALSIMRPGHPAQILQAMHPGPASAGGALGGLMAPPPSLTQFTQLEDGSQPPDGETQPELRSQFWSFNFQV